MKSYLKSEVRLKGAAYAKFKRQIVERDKICQNPICQWPEASLTIEHIIPRSRMRLDVPWNCVILCAPCNGEIKYGTLLIEWQNNKPGADKPPRPLMVFTRDGGPSSVWICEWEAF